MESKVGMVKLQETEDKLETLVDKVISSFNKRFMDKKEIKRNNGHIEKQISFLYDALMSKINDIEASDPMIAKKPIGGWSCLNCSKSLSHLHGNMVDYQVNKKFPYRDPAERIAKAQGF